MLATSVIPGLQSLRELAGVSAFRVFVTSTPDDLLVRAVDAERHGGLQRTEQIVFAPKLPSGTATDLPKVQSSAFTAVCYLFGRPDGTDPGGDVPAA